MEDETCSFLTFHRLQQQHVQDQFDRDDEDAFSLCDLSSGPCSTPSFFPSPSKQDASAFEFEFESVIAPPSALTVSHVDTVIFCGKAIAIDKPRYLIRSNSSLKRLRTLREDITGSNQLELQRSDSLHFSRVSSEVAPPTGGSARYGTSSSGKKYKALIGVTKFPSRMDLGDIKRRQSKQTPAPLIPTGAGGDWAMVAASGERGQMSRLSLRQLLRCKSRTSLMRKFARASLGCIRHV